MKIKIYLASKSKQRRDILRKARMAFEVVDAPYVERFGRGEKPERAAMRIALGKARAAQLPSLCPAHALVVGSDTLVAFGGKILGKAKTRAHARRMLRSFSGKPQWVITGVAVLDARTGAGAGARSGARRARVFYDKSKVVFRKMTAEQIEWYLDTGEWRDKAGAFALQGKGAHLIARTAGSQANIIGFPIEKFKRVLKTFF